MNRLYFGKKILACMAMLMLSAPVWCQGTRLSARAAALRNELAAGKTSLQEIESRYRLVHTSDGVCVQAFVGLNEGVDAKDLGAYGVTTGMQAADLATALVPVDRYADFVASGLCSHIELSKEVHPLLDMARIDLGVDYIYQGLNLPQGYDGTGVVVGMIDIGFEYGHPAFYDSTGTTLRIKRVWQQTDSGGSHPAGFSYGSELVTEAQILAAVTDNPDQGHGSHTAGIAAGCGGPAGNGSNWRGMAPAADIVMVATNLSDASIIDGIAYIHSYARSVGKPCVINISLGSQMDSHDGLSETDMILANYLQTTSTDSLVIVVSAGNSGETANHLHKSFSDTDTVVTTVMFDFLNMDPEYSAMAMCWGDTGSNFSVSLSLYYGGFVGDLDSVPVFESPFLSTDRDTFYTYNAVGGSGRDYTCDIYVTHQAEYNHRPNILVYIHRDGLMSYHDYFALTIKGQSGNVHLWSDSFEFIDDSNPSFTAGDYDYLIGGVGANSNAVISVGSYVSRTTRPAGSSLGGVEGFISSFSSHGPTVDGRVKPDICAPGQYLVSAINSSYLPTYNTYINYTADEVDFNGSTYYYALMQGTSMAAPVVTGIVALWMQHNAALNVDTVRALLHSTALRDQYTGDIPAGGSNIWGWGKVNAFGGLPATTVPMYRLDVRTSNRDEGSVAGQGRHPQGQHVVDALPKEGYAFSHWSDGDTNAHRSVNLTSDTVLVACFEQIPCDTISQFPWEAEFTTAALLCWDTYGARNWRLTSLGMSSYGFGDTDNWLLSPDVLVAQNTLLFYNITGYENDSVDIVISDEMGDIEVLAEEVYTALDTLERYVDLSPYAGRVVQFGFHHHSNASYSSVYLTAARIGYMQGIGESLPQDCTVITSGLRFTVAGAPEGRLNVYDVMGRRVLSSPTADGTFSIPSAGVYIISIGDFAPRKIVLVK